MKSSFRIITLVMFIFLLLPLVAANTEMKIISDKIFLGETIIVERIITFPQLTTFNPIFLLPIAAADLKITSSVNETISYEVFHKEEYNKLQEYFKKVCSVDEEGWIPADGGWTIQQGNLTITTEGGYCHNYENIKPDDQFNVVVINYSKLTIPIVYFSINYTLRKDATKNIHCDYNEYPNKTVEYFLPKDAFGWSAEPPLNENITNQDHFLIDYRVIDKNRICFSYGTKSEYESSLSNENGFWILYLSVSLGILGLFLSLIHPSLRTNKLFLRLYWLLGALLLVLFIVFIAYFPREFSIIPPFFSFYLKHLIYSLMTISLFYFVALLYISLIYKTCPYCNRIIKRNGYEQHLTKSHSNL